MLDPAGCRPSPARRARRVAARRSGPAVPALAAAATTIALAATTSPALAGDTPRAILGYDALHARLGDDAPTGAGIIVGFAEAQESGGSWGPDMTLGELSGKNLSIESPGAPGTSGHATAVMRQLCGDGSSIAPGILDVFLWEANHWVTGFLNFGQGGATPPDPLPASMKVLNNSWVGQAGPASDNEVLRRIDTLVNRDKLLIINGVGNNPASNLPLNSHSFNSIAVGVRTGNHTSLATATGIDGPGRMKPEIVGTAGATSFAAPQVAAIGAVLWETAQTSPGLSTNLNTRRIPVIRAVLLAGATKENLATGAWTNAPAISGPDRGVTLTPIDDVVGVGTANVDRSHLVFTALEQDGTADPALAAGLPSRGWDYDAVSVGSSRYWGIELPAGGDSLSVVLTWNRNVTLSSGEWGLADLDLELLRREPGGGLVPLVGDAGLDWFTGGNVASRSPVDNIEHLHVTGLAPGSYVLRAARLDTGGSVPGAAPFAVAWFGPDPADTTVPEDVDGDGVVGLGDILLVLSNFGPCGAPCTADIDESGVVDFLDVLAILSAWS